MPEIQNGKTGYQATVRMVAIKFGTVVGERGIIHVNPKSSQKRQREPLVSEADAELLEKRKFAVRATSDPDAEARKSAEAKPAGARGKGGRKSAEAKPAGGGQAPGEEDTGDGLAADDVDAAPAPAE